ncbi:MAG: hypothetical protein KF893_19815 [Caldilineaceae bacterium]|nr:hypothetical protein [Caldilineaceae bacterium]
MKSIAAILTEYRPRSHADVIVTKFFTGFPTDDGLIPPRVKIASMYVDQFAEAGADVAINKWAGGDLSRRYSQEFNVPIYRSIVDALTLGGESLAVDGVLLIGEHGRYAWNEKGQHLYPRKYFLEQIAGVMATSGRSVPVFNDKHLSYNWHDARWMYDRLVGLGAPFMAGSSLPLGWRRPWLEHELGAPISEALAIGYSGLDVYGFHTLETLQCMIERRRGGESGVVAVTCLEGDAVWDAARAGLWPLDLAEAAWSTIEDRPAAGLSGCAKPAIFLLEYADGARGAVLMLDDYIADFAYAARIGDEITATEVYLQDNNPYCHFSYLSLNIEEMFVTGVPSYPVERTLLTTGVLEAALDSRFQGHIRLETPHLNIAYQPRERIPWRPQGPRPTGACVA